MDAAIIDPYGEESDVDRVENEIEDQEEGEIDDDCSDCLEDSPQDSQGVGVIKDILNKIYKYFGKAFSISKTKIIHGFDTLTKSASDIKLSINTDLECTWLKEPTPKGSDSIGTWPKKDLKFLSKQNWVHEDFTKMIPKQLPIKFVSGEAEKFFAKKFVGAPGKISLPSQVFTQDTFTMPKSDNHLYEYFGRQGTLECEITHNLLDLTDDMIKALVAKFDTLDLSKQDDEKVNVIKDTFINLSNVNRLAIQSNYRSKTFAIVSCVKAKTELRDTVLNKFKGTNNTKNTLRGSNFFTDSLFGPLPDTLTDNLNSCSSRSTAVLSPIFHFPKTVTKRKSDTSYVDYPDSKRGKFNRRGNNSGRGGFSNSPNYNNMPVSKFATSPHFHNQPQNHQRGRGQKKRGSKR